MKSVAEQAKTTRTQERPAMESWSATRWLVAAKHPTTSMATSKTQNHLANPSKDKRTANQRDLCPSTMEKRRRGDRHWGGLERSGGDWRESAWGGERKGKEWERGDKEMKKGHEHHSGKRWEKWGFLTRATVRNVGEHWEQLGEEGRCLLRRKEGRTRERLSAP